MRRRTRTVMAVVVATIMGLGIAGCAGAAEKTVEHTADSVTLAPGETLVVDFGEINPSVGDAWVITQEPDAAVLGPGEEETRYTGEEGMTGAPSELSYRFAPVGTGTTVIEFEYQFRGEVPEDLDDQKTAKIEVTVR
ncbi:protease inhibitor I42 family protein [Microbacterium aurantiacum]|uniref:protease inhibitor I42 family protein n=1 Tax=Microbacterium aurantiacum TaxID=162393 RepID=UPI0011AED0E8|nr:protease inhibitor I42 family protein [Microbacterium aurantiacum]